VSVFSILEFGDRDVTRKDWHTQGCLTSITVLKVNTTERESERELAAGKSCDKQRLRTE